MMKLCLGLFMGGILLVPGGASALEIRKVDFQEKRIEIEFMDRGRVLRLQDEEGWLTLRTLSLLAYQDLVEKSYLQPKRSELILRQDSPWLEKLSPAFAKTLKFMKTRVRDPLAKDRIEALMESEIFDLSGSPHRHVEAVLTSHLEPLLALESTKGSIKYRLGREVIEAPRWSLNPSDPISYPLSASGLRIPATSKYRTPSRIDWTPEKLDFKGL